MSYFAENMTIEKKVIVTFFGTKYVTAKGLTGVLADGAAIRILETHRRDNHKKYGKPTYSNRDALKLWRSSRSRLRKIFYRRALPHIEKLFATAK